MRVKRASLLNTPRRKGSHRKVLSSMVESPRGLVKTRLQEGSHRQQALDSKIKQLLTLAHNHSL